jgi:hypothetical protein
MRTTLALDDDVFEQVKKYAEGRGVSMGKAASELIRRGIERPVPTHIVNGLHVFSAPPGGPRVTSEQVRELESEQDLEKVLPYIRGRKR